MTDYNETTVSGTCYQRAYRIVLDNILGTIPSANFVEEKVMNISSEQIKIPCSNITVDMSVPNKSFQLRNISTGELIPDVFYTYEQVYQIIYSAYWDAALERDTPPE
jgi:hypothetical protein